MDVSLAQALAWRLERHFLVAGARSVTEVVRRLGAVPAWSGDPGLATGRRSARPSSDALAGALSDGDLIRTYAFRGATHLLAADDAGVYLAVRCANRQWELPSWQAHYKLSPRDWPALREVVRDVVAHRPVRHAELIERVANYPRFRHLRAALADPSHTLLKPLAWQGDLCFGPVQDGQITFQSPAASPRWTGIPDLHEAGRRAILAYLAAYGPATRDNLRYWLVAGLSAGRRRLDGWIGDLIQDHIAEIQVDGSPMLHLREHLASLTAAAPKPEGVILLPGYDQWMLGAGTADHRIVPAARRPAVTRGANVALQAGQVSATWNIDRGVVAVSWFAEVERPSREELDDEVERLSGLLGRDFTMTIAVS
ncbi:hypothetical protein CFN78_11970 [Amycolatopsis antarctica]|uniref:Winged helix DNA-binding domain-containing protein n=1 Tax=Amycolatopsis antarctica TaxID=1854586 RepID=A0A263D3L9_9PSEU|nr:crosslink repair DNA glycosylase YcaQ family protein [Amycolatopsis antarctica]OZM72961.1 hypothetical protein CFN78_11970 [Amycolatopsis antarctica]